MPFGELLDLIAIEQIKKEGAIYKKSISEEETDFWKAMDKE